MSNKIYTMPIFDIEILRGEVLRFVHGLHNPRRQPVSRKEICKKFRCTPAKTVDEALADLIAENKLRRFFTISARRMSMYEPIANG